MLGDVGEQRGPGGGDLCGHESPFLRQVQTQHPPVDSVAPSLDPAPPLEIGDQPADRALLELQPRSELALGKLVIARKLRQRMRHRGAHRLATWRLLDIEQTKGPNEAHHLTLKLLAVFHTLPLTADGCIIQPN